MLEIAMSIALFILGFGLGASLIHLYYLPFHQMVKTFDARYAHLIEVLAEWQKKV